MRPDEKHNRLEPTQRIQSRIAKPDRNVIGLIRSEMVRGWVDEGGSHHKGSGRFTQGDGSTRGGVRTDHNDENWLHTIIVRLTNNPSFKPI